MKRKQRTFSWLKRHLHYGGSAYPRLLEAAALREKLARDGAVSPDAIPDAMDVEQHT